MAQLNNKMRDGVSTAVEELADKIKGRMVISLRGTEWEDAGQKLEFAILLKRASGKSFKKKLLVDLLNGVWKLAEQPTFQKVEDNILLVNFQTEKDRDMVLEGGPWSFEGEALVLQKWEEGMTAEDFSNTKINIFIQVYGLPFELRKDEGARSVVEQICTIKEHKSNGSLRESAYGREYMRYRIEIDIDTPILDGFFLERRGRRPTWVYLKYEKLPTICFHCGILTHGTSQCTHVHKDKEMELKYGVWIKAEERTENIQVWADKMEAGVAGNQTELRVSEVTGIQSELTTHTPMMVDPASQMIEPIQEVRAIVKHGQRTLIDRGKKLKGQGSTKGMLPREMDDCNFGIGAPNRGEGQGVMVQLSKMGQRTDLGQRSVKDWVRPSPPIVFKWKAERRKRNIEGCWGVERNLEKKRKDEEGGSKGILYPGSEGGLEDECSHEVCDIDSMDKAELAGKLCQEQ